MSDPNRRWWNGKVAGISTILAVPLAVLGLIGLQAFTGWVGDAAAWAADVWDNAWPTGQVIALVGLSLMLAVMLALTCRKLRAVRWDLGSAKANAEASRVSAAEEIEAAVARADAAEQRAADLERNRDELLPDRVDTDRALFRRLMDLLGSESEGMRFVRQHPFDLSYDDSRLRDLREFVHEWEDADHEFQIADLEEARRKLHERARDFLNHMATHAFVRSDTSEYRIYPDHDLDWETGENKFAFDAIRRASALASEIWEAQQELVRRARRIVGE